MLLHPALQVRARAETTRMALAYGGFDWEDYTPMEYWGVSWKTAKEQGKAPFGQLPLLDVDGVLIPQTIAQSRYRFERITFCVSRIRVTVWYQKRACILTMTICLQLASSRYCLSVYLNCLGIPCSIFKTRYLKCWFFICSICIASVLFMGEFIADTISRRIACNIQK